MGWLVDMARQKDEYIRDMYELDHKVSYHHVQSFFRGYKIISDQISREALDTICNNLADVLRKDVAGDIVEFGCYIGTTSVFLRRVLNTLGESDKRFFHVYDSFQGLPEKTHHDKSAAGDTFRAGALAVGKKAFLHEFSKANLKPPIIHKGWFSDLTEKDVPEKIAFAFLDGDFYESIRDSLRLVLPRMQKGGVIVVDDYVREALPGAAKAVHEYFQQEHVKAVHNLGVIYL